MSTAELSPGRLLRECDLVFLLCDQPDGLVLEAHVNTAKPGGASERARAVAAHIGAQWERLVQAALGPHTAATVPG